MVVYRISIKLKKPVPNNITKTLGENNIKTSVHVVRTKPRIVEVFFFKCKIINVRVSVPLVKFFSKP